MGGIITDDQRQDVIENMPEKLKDAVTAIFANFYATEGAYDDMLDFGYPTIMITLDSRSQDFITTEPGAYGWFEAPVKFRTLGSVYESLLSILIGDDRHARCIFITYVIELIYLSEYPISISTCGMGLTDIKLICLIVGIGYLCQLLRYRGCL